HRNFGPLPPRTVVNLFQRADALGPGHGTAELRFAIADHCAEVDLPALPRPYRGWGKHFKGAKTGGALLRAAQERFDLRRKVITRRFAALPGDLPTAAALIDQDGLAVTAELQRAVVHRFAGGFEGATEADRLALFNVEQLVGVCEERAAGGAFVHQVV